MTKLYKVKNTVLISQIFIYQTFEYRPKAKTESMIACCTDGVKPVFFKVERIEE